LASGMRLPPIRAYMDDMTTMTTTVACTNRLLGKFPDSKLTLNQRGNMTSKQR